MRIGISPFARTREGSFAVADAALAGGIDTFWLGEGLLEVDAFPRWAGGMEPYVWLSYLAGRYPGVRVGLGASALPLRDVQWLAKSATTLDIITGGNHVLAVSPGFWRREFLYRGLEFDRRGTLFEDGVHALRAAFTGDEYHGATVDLPVPGRLSPAPLSPGGPPLWLAGGEGTVKRALRLGLPFQASRLAPDTLAPLAERWFDRGGGQLGIRIAVNVESAVRTEPAGPIPGDQIAGPPGYIADQLTGYAELGVSEISIIPGGEDDISLRTVSTLVEQVLPSIRW
jgi:alkanesulfonate monooxygenase SsuD/methylene tetrahydromethanopterin reductase-like flavin-dependent oxidoreductase (luciferase family)